MTLVLFTPHGKTFTFKDVIIVTDNETMLEAMYTAMSDGKQKKLVAQKANLVAYSIAEA
jgi:hypothetical protein